MAAASASDDERALQVLTSTVNRLAEAYQRMVGGRYPDREFLILTQPEISRINQVMKGGARVLLETCHPIPASGLPAVISCDPHRLERPPGGFYLVDHNQYYQACRRTMDRSSELWRQSVAVLTTTLFAPGIPVLTRAELDDLCEYHPALLIHRNLFELVPVDQAVTTGNRTDGYHPYKLQRPSGGFWKLDLRHTEAIKTLREVVEKRLTDLWTRFDRMQRHLNGQSLAVATSIEGMDSWSPERKRAEQEWRAKAVAEKAQWVAARQTELEAEARIQAEKAKALADDRQAEEDALLLTEIQARQARRTVRRQPADTPGAPSSAS